MINRENLIAALEGKRPEYFPLTVNEEFVLENPAPEWEELYRQGLCLIPYTSTVKETTPNVERVVKAETYREQPAERLVLRTPVGEISQLSSNGWVQEFFLKTPHDYRVMEFIVRDTRMELDPQAFFEAENNLGDRGITLISGRRSPMQTILVDYAGLEEFSFHLAEGFPELFSLQEALMDQLVKMYGLIAAGPGRYVSLLENLTAETWGPERFLKYHMPVYEKLMPILHAGDKKVYVHCDGKLACLAGFIAKTDIDGIESITAPPEGDMSFGEAHAAMPGKVFWANINVSHYNLPPVELKKKVLEFACQASPDGINLAFEISEDLPVNWRQSIPVVLEALKV